MSVFIRKDTADGTYSYRFNFKGDRFSGNTGKTRKREAEEVERDIREQIRKAWDSRKTVARPDASMTVSQACTRFWEDNNGNVADTDKLAWSLGWIEKHFGNAMLLVDIDDNEIARMVAKRRGEFNPNYKTEKKLVAKTTVNRSVVEPMRHLLRRARKVWKVPVQEIEWSMHFLPEPQERVREATPQEEEAIFANLKRGYDAAVYFGIRMGARREEILNLEHPHIDFINNRLTLDGKGSKKRSVPIPSDVRELLWSIRHYHPVKVFTYEAAYTRKAGRNSPATVRGQRYPLTASGIEEAFSTALKDAGVTSFRFHDLRHTAATQLLRSSGNLRLVQNLLGHAKIETTMKYAHVTNDDLARAMEQTKSHRDGTVAKTYTESYTRAGVPAAND